MHLLRHQLPAMVELNSDHAPRVIAVGLVVLLANSFWPALPVMSGISLVALGATLSVVTRFRSSPARPYLIAAHSFVYFTLYLLVIGAVLHASMAQPGDGLRLVQAIDLLLSMVPMVAAIRAALTASAADEDVPAR
jgi:hypothetical protein